jgi:hypothetical protein
VTAASPQRVRRFAEKLAAQLAGKTRGPDASDGSDRRVPHRHSYEENTPEAKPWRKVGDGSIGQGLAHREALLQAAKEQVHQDWIDNPAERARSARERRSAVAAELEQLMEAGDAPVGRPATLRMELAELDDVLAGFEKRLRRIDVTILEALIKHVDFATGRLYPAIETIAAKAGCHRNSVIAGLRRLKAKGFIAWVRRTIRTGNEGEFGPQLEQTSNAYFFDHRQGMAARTWARFTQILVTKLRRLGAIPAGVAGGGSEIACPALRAALDSFGSSVANAST